MNLLRAELRRLAMRRVGHWTLVVVLGLLAVTAVGVGYSHQRLEAETLADARAAAEAEFEVGQERVEQDIAQCELAHESGDPAQWPEDCEQIRAWYPSVDQLVEYHLPPTFELRTGFPEMVLVFAGLVGMLAFIVGASYVGAEWRTGGMTNLLLWRPRRVRVLGAKLTALVTALTGLTVVLWGVWVAAFWLVAHFRGVTDTMTAGVWQSHQLAGVRALVLVLAAGVVGFAAASIGRHTAAAMGIGIATFVASVAGVNVVLGELLELTFWQRWDVTTYVRAWLDRSVVLRDFDGPCEVDAEGACVPPTMEITWQVSGVLLAALVVIMIGGALWHVRRRDVV